MTLFYKGRERKPKRKESFNIIFAVSIFWILLFYFRSVKPTSIKLKKQIFVPPSLLETLATSSKSNRTKMKTKTPLNLKQLELSVPAQEANIKSFLWVTASLSLFPVCKDFRFHFAGLKFPFLIRFLIAYVLVICLGSESLREWRELQIKRLFNEERNCRWFCTLDLSLPNYNTYNLVSGFIWKIHNWINLIT